MLSVLNAWLLVAIGLLMLSGQVGLLATWGFELLAPLHYDALLKYL